MSFPSLLGALLGIGLLIFAVVHATQDVSSFFSVTEFLIVVGGTIAAAYMSFHHRYVNIAFKAVWWMLKKPKATREALTVEIMRLIKWSYLVQKKGLPALEGEIRNVQTDEPLIKFCLMLVTSNHTPAELRTMMETAIEAEYERSVAPVEVLRSMGANLPTFGMIGTLVGMVVMLQNFSADMSQVGRGMSMAMLATLYGVVFARLVCYPAAFKLQQKMEIERFRNYMIAEGLLLLAEKKGPRFMQDRLNSFLDPTIHFDMDRQIKGQT
ncbi:MAG: MotA/TolQ/ExbB proton channel family protein [Rickettsiales bacterium]|nr:MotA/TolQ/ExbB proton channel family protein [Rickettsiales bacterium]